MINDNFRNMIKSIILLLSSIFAALLFYSKSKVLLVVCLCIILSAIVICYRRKIINSLLDKESYILKLYSLFFLFSIIISCIYATLKYPEIIVGPRLLFEIFFRIRNQYIAIALLSLLSSPYFFVISKIIIAMIFKSLKHEGFNLSFDKLFREAFRSNVLILISTFSFFLLPCRPSIGSIFGAIYAVAFSIVICGQKKNILKNTFKNFPKSILIVSVFSSFGIAINAYLVFTKSAAVEKIINSEIIPFAYNEIKIFASILAILSLISIFVSLCWFYDKFYRLVLYIINEQEYTRREMFFYVVMITLSVVYITIIFINSNVFYNDQYDYDIIYTSDSPELIRYNAYLSICHSENDLRQPLFALFSAPFMGIPYLLSKVFSIFIDRWLSEALFEAYAQIILLLFSYLLLARILKIKRTFRPAFIGLIACTYTSFLFSIMLEQYIICFFWLLLFINVSISNNPVNKLPLFGACGTLTTSWILVPFLMFCYKDNYSINSIKKQFHNIVNIIMIYIFIMIVAGKFELLFNLTWKLSEYGSYSGSGIPFYQKIKQYTAFISGCFISQESQVDLTKNIYPSWQLTEVNSLNIVGVIILLVAVTGLLLTIKDRISKISLGWIVFSFFILVVLGWGTAENGLVLYSLYFFWPFIGGIVRLIQLCESRIHSLAIITIEIVSALLLVYFNIPQIRSLLIFSTAYYGI